MTPIDETLKALGPARKRIYWIVRNKVELLRDTGQTKDADFDNEAWELISATLDAYPALREEIETTRAALNSLNSDANALLNGLAEFGEDAHKYCGELVEALEASTAVAHSALIRRTLQGGEENG